MRFSVRHETLYRYSAPVRLASHVLRLEPAHRRRRSCGAQPDYRPHANRSPGVDGPTRQLDHACGFRGLVRLPAHREPLDLDTVAAAPAIDQGPPLLPWPSALGDGMAEYRSGDERDVVVRGFASELASESGWAVLTFLDRLNRTLFTRVKHDIQIEGPARTPAHTLATGRGACRDVTVLFMAACHSLGIAARFRERLSGARRHPRRAASSACVARGVPAGLWLARLRPNAWPCRRRRSCRALRSPGPGGDNARRRRLLRGRRRRRARIRRADFEQLRLGDDISGALITGQNGSRIAIRKSDTETRQRFSIARETAHHYLRHQFERGEQRK